MTARATSTRKESHSDRLTRRPLLAALLSSQQAAKARYSGVQKMADDMIATPVEFLVAQGKTPAATG